MLSRAVGAIIPAQHIIDNELDRARGTAHEAIHLHVDQAAEDIRNGSRQHSLTIKSPADIAILHCNTGSPGNDPPSSQLPLFAAFGWISKERIQSPAQCAKALAEGFVDAGRKYSFCRQRCTDNETVAAAGVRRDQDLSLRRSRGFGLEQPG